mmetsp:Transcript_111361/g.319955  ORF Transcript_111361/g.319955 Transcript_111361/m.319955 type:complete len:421 (+) Transcript_111361:56-1318(+)|eukprot:CAMPEP_0170216156 /NCGR_PEP_ID=MMETSP0116_2-20130129/7732_1 /TAXON_ID=400756 /ORGANISM="Durinskia baltica, Strain CSIRO CS-38" /LENGTH=420 /DNA_ID=CAMNT_0010466767 /DNA_START=202 /DNA_END=1464 /DNA_ORIENTATION=-
MMIASKCSSFVVLALVSAASIGVDGFVHPASTVASRPSISPLSDATGWDNFCIEDSSNRGQLQVSPEVARRFRRTVYTHDDWKKHRQQDRFLIYLGSMFKSGVYENSRNEILLTTAIATFVVVYNALRGGYTDISGVVHPAPLPGQVIGIPMNVFTLTGSSLGLLLTFRANASYKRWDEARKNWGMNINHTRDLVRMANCYYDRDVDPEVRQEDLNHVALCTWAFVRAMKRHLSPAEEDEFAFQLELREKLSREQAEMIIASAHRPNRALQDLSFAIDQLPMHFVRKNEIHQAVTIFEDNLGSSERLLTSPVPLFYSRHTARFITCWLFLMPLGLYSEFKGSWNHISMIPATFLIALFMFGIEELATQLEEPFTILPMQAFCDKIYNWCMEIMSWSPGDNGRQLKPIKPEHQYFHNPNRS